jgi:hypothetical protein
VSPDLCPCRHNGQWYPPNATIQEDCNIWYAQSHHLLPYDLVTPDSPGHHTSSLQGVKMAGAAHAEWPVPWGPSRILHTQAGYVWTIVDGSVLSLAHSVCQGQRWHCTGQRCSGWCQASGAPHYVTFDGLVFTFPGACEYLLVREAGGRFSVSVQNLPCGASGLTCTKALVVRLDSTVVHMLRGDCDLARMAGYRQRVWGKAA